MESCLAELEKEQNQERKFIMQSNSSTHKIMTIDEAKKHLKSLDTTKFLIASIQTVTSLEHAERSVLKLILKDSELSYPCSAGLLSVIYCKLPEFAIIQTILTQTGLDTKTVIDLMQLFQTIQDGIKQSNGALQISVGKIVDNLYSCCVSFHNHKLSSSEAQNDQKVLTINQIRKEFQERWMPILLSVLACSKLGWLSALPNGELQWQEFTKLPDDR
jgi:hypothetical protein